MRNNLTVVKDNKVIQASYRLSLIEQRIILSCIAQIDSMKSLSETQGFTIKVSDIQDLVTPNTHYSSLYTEVKKAINKLYNRTIVLDGEESERRWIYEKRYNNNEGSVTLFFSPTIIPYLSELKNNFTKYRLSEVRQFSSAHSIRLYELLVQWQNIGQREMELEWLKNVLGLSEKYPRTNNFIQRVVKPCVTEINQHSRLTVEYDTKKSGRTITHIKFKFNTKQEQDVKQKNHSKPKMTVEQFVRENPVLTCGKTIQEVLTMMTEKNKE